MRFALASLLTLFASITSCGRPYDLGGGGSTTTSAGGSGGASSTTSSSSSTTITTSSTSSQSSSSSSGVIDAGPTGPTALTIVNGINDYPAVRLCFLPGDAPWPADPAGLAFAASAVVSPLDATIPIDGDVTPWVIAGDLTQTAGKTCTQILASAGDDAGANGILARPLALIPKVVWASNKSLLMVPNGCVGGPGHDDANGKNACGSGYSASSPTASVTLVSMSRIEDPSHVSFQVASASPALPELDYRVLPNLTSATPIPIVASLTQGAIGPNPPFAALTANELGALDGVQIQTYTAGTSFMSSAVPLSEVLSHGGVGAAEIANGGSVVLVAVGAAPGLPTGGFWHGLTYTMVKASP